MASQDDTRRKIRERLAARTSASASPEKPEDGSRARRKPKGAQGRSQAASAKAPKSTKPEASRKASRKASGTRKAAAKASTKAAADPQGEEPVEKLRSSGPPTATRPRKKSDDPEVQRQRALNRRYQQERRERISDAHHAALAVARVAFEAYKKTQKGTWRPSLETRAQVAKQIGLGVPMAMVIAGVIHPNRSKPIAEPEFRKIFAHEIAVAPSLYVGHVVDALHRRALGVVVRDRGKYKELPPDTAAAIFLAKTRAGFREEQHVEVNVKSGVLIPPQTGTVSEWIERVRDRNADAVKPGSDES